MGILGGHVENEHAVHRAAHEGRVAVLLQRDRARHRRIGHEVEADRVAVGIDRARVQGHLAGPVERALVTIADSGVTAGASGGRLVLAATTVITSVAGTLSAMPSLATQLIL